MSNFPLDMPINVHVLPYAAVEQVEKHTFIRYVANCCTNFFHYIWQVNSVHVVFSFSHCSYKIYLTLVLFQVTEVFKELGFYQFTVQVEKEQYFTHMAGVSLQLKTEFGFGGEGRHSLNSVKAI